MTWIAWVLLALLILAIAFIFVVIDAFTQAFRR